MEPNAPASPTADAAKSVPFAPTAFGKYYLVDRIAMGGMAEIFKAKTFGHGGFENQLVIKRILAHLSDNDSFVRMFMDEAKVSVLLQHGNIVRIYDFGKLRENYFIAMECVEGKDVKQILRKLAERRKTLPAEFAVYIAMEAAKGLDYAHKKTTLQGQPLNIVHRDVSPSNLLVSYQAEVKVADFGIVKAANIAEDTDVGTLKGKFEYMSPEQAGGKDLDRRSDIFSLGIILHEMLTGRRLFKSENEMRTLERIKAVDVDPPSATNPQVPARLDNIVMRALARDPDDRYQDAREMYGELAEFLYPASPDLTQQSFAHFLSNLFADEIAAERTRLEEGTRIALAMHESASQVELEPEWEESGGTRGSHPTGAVAPPAGSKAPLLIAAGAVAFALLLAAGFVLSRPAPAPVVVQEVVEAAPATGAVDLRIGPVAARVTIDGTLSGEGVQVAVGDLAPGDHVVLVEADGYAPHEEKVTLAAGDRLRLSVALQPVAAQVATSSRRGSTSRGAAAASSVAAQAPGAETGLVAFHSSPSGADVFVDGKLAGRTPFEWDGPSGTKHSVEYRLAGHDSARFNMTVPGKGVRESYDRTLTEKAKAEGKLSANVSGGWADIYVDGKKIGTTPIFGFSLPAGSHEVRAKNDSAGLDVTKTVVVKAGETASVPFSAN